MFKTRLLSGIVLVILALVLIITGGEVLLFSTLVISCIGMFELYRVFHVEKSILAAVGYIAAIVFYCDLQWNFIPDRMMLFMGFMILLMFVFVFAYPKYHASEVMAVFFGLFYVAVMLSFVYQIRTLERGLYLAFLVFTFRSQMNLTTVEIWIIAGIAAVAALISMVGDLTASAIKRNYDIKDYGHLIPGHGGILDRFDSMIITAPIIYYLALHIL